MFNSKVTKQTVEFFSNYSLILVRCVLVQKNVVL